MKKRIDWITYGKKKKYQLPMVFLFTCFFLLSGMTVFAYEYPQEINGTLKNDEENQEYIMDFTPYEEFVENHIDFTDSNVVFEDEMGNVIPLYPQDGIGKQSICSHVYVNGKVQIHNKKSGDGCEVITYNAKRCKKCGQIIRGDIYSTIKYAKCPH